MVVSVVASIVGPVGGTGVASAGSVGEIPQQEWGTAAGRGHEVARERPGQGGVGGDPHDPSSVPGALPAEVAYPDPVLGDVVPEVAEDVRVGDGTTPVVGGEEGSRRELVNRRTAEAQVFRNADGTETRRVFQGRRFFSRNGLWFPIDSALVADGGTWRTKSESVHKRFAEVADADVVASLELEPGVSFGYGVAGVVGAAGRVDGTAITYEDVRAGVDLELEANSGGIKETLVLESVDAPTEWSFPLRLDGLTASLDAGSVVLKDASDVVRAVIPPGFMEDSAVDPRSGEGARSWGVAYRLDGDVLHVSLDRAWLANPARVFPVKADPSVVAQTSTGTTFVQDPYTADYSGDPNLSVGTFDGGTNKANAFLKFDSVGWALAGQYILGVNLWLYNTWSYSCDPRTVWVHEVTQGWSVSGAKSWPGPSFGPALGNATFASGHEGCSPGGAWQKVGLGDNGRNVVHGWTHGAPNNGLTVRASESDSRGWKKFAGRNSANPPYLEITYTPYWATYHVGAMTTPVAFDQDGKMQVTVTNHGRDTWTPGSNYKLNYRLYNSAGTELPSVMTSMPHDVRPGESAAVLATIGRLGPGSYRLRFDMDLYGTTRFSSVDVPMSQEVAFTISNTVPALTSMSPPSNYVTEVLTPTLALTARDPDNHPGIGLSYRYRLCDAGGDGLQNCTLSDWMVSTWTVPEGKLSWGKSYVWYGVVTDGANTSPWSHGSYLTAQASQPAITSHLGTASDSPGGAVEPGVGNYTTTATDAVVAAVGPPLSVVRSYNSLDPRRKSVFGAGWSTRWDTAITTDGDGSGNVVVTYPEGYQVRFGKRPDGTYAPPAGRFATLVTVAGGGWKLTTKGHVNYAFGADGKLTSISDDSGRNQTLTHVAGRLSTATDTVSGRSLSFTWTGDHVTRVTTGPDPALSWDYTYDDDRLTKVCDPTGGCTVYDYADALHYRSTVLDANPSGYWRFHDSAGTTAANRAPLGGQSHGTYSNVTLGAPSAMPGSGITSARFNGTTSFVKLPNNTIGTRSSLTVELWFKTGSTTGGVLLGTSATAQPTGPATGGGVPILYVGTDGKLYGHFWNNNVAGIVTSAQVNDGNWHHVVLSGAVDRQTLYLDGTAVGTQTGVIAHADPLAFVGAGPVNSGAWPARPVDDWGRFTGDISDVAVYHRPLSASTVSEHWAARTLTKVLSKATLPGGRVVAQVVYDRAGDRVATHTDHNGGTWTLEWLSLTSSTSASTVMSNPDGQAITYYLNPSRNGRLAGTKNSSNHTVAYSYDVGGFVSTVTNEDGDDIRYANDARGNVLQESLCRNGLSCNASQRSLTHYAYYLNTADPLDPRNDRVVERRDGRSTSATDNRYLTTYTYNAAGVLSGTTRPGSTETDRRSTARAFTSGAEAAVGGGTMPAGLLLTETDAMGGITRHAYDAKGNLRETVDPAGLRTTAQYDGLGRVTSRTTISSTTPNGSTTTFTYDGLSRPVTTVEPEVANVVTGAAHQRRTTITYNADGTIASSKIDDASLNDPGRTTSYTYDAFGRVATLTDPTGAVTTTEYDGFGQPTRRVDAAGNEFTFTYTTLRHQLATTTVKGFTGDGGAPRDIVLESRAYTPAGFLGQRVDAMGGVHSFLYNPDGSLSGEKLMNLNDPEEFTDWIQLDDYQYDDAGNVISHGARNQRFYTTSKYDFAGRLAETTATYDRCSCTHSSKGQVTRYTYDANDNVTAVTVANSRDGALAERVEYTRDAVGRELTRAVHTGTGILVTTTTRDERGLPLTVTDPRGTGYTTTFSHDALGRLVTTTGPQVQAESGGQPAVAASAVRKTGYNTFGEVVDELDPLGRQVRTGYDGMGRPTSTTLPDYTPPGATQPITATATTGYDGLGRVTSTTDPLGARTDFEYDQLGNRVRKIDPLLPGQAQRGVWTATYDPLGDQLSTTDPNGAQVFATYNHLGNQLTSTVVERVPSPTRNLTTRFRYDDGDRVKVVTTPDGQVTQYGYDLPGNVVRKIDALGNTTLISYDAAGRQTAHKDPSGRTSTVAYDLAGRPVTASDLDSAGAVLRSRAFGHDAAGNRTSATDSLGKTTTWVYDALNQVRSITRPGGITTSYGYDVAGNVTRATDGNGNSTTFTVNAWNLPESTVEPATAQTPNAVDRTFTQSYDAAGRVSVLTKPGGVSVTSTYDPLGNLVKQAGAGASVATPDRVFGFDPVGRMTSASAPGGANTYAYDDRGNLVNATGPSGASTFAYDDRNRLSTVSTSAGTTSYGYDVAGRLASAQDPITGSTATYTRDTTGRTTAIGYGTGSSTRTFTYDPLGRPATDTVTAPGGAITTSTAYTFDTEDRLTGKTTTGLAGAGVNTYGYDDAGRLTSWNNGTTTTDYGWDGAGNLTRDGPVTATYDQRNHLLTRGGLTNTYTARGTLASRTTDSTTTNLAFNAYDELVTEGTTTNTYDALGRLTGTLAYQGTGQTIISAGTDLYTHTPDGSPLGVKQGTTTATAVTDLHTDLVAAINPATGELTGSRTYSPFGTVQASTGTQPGLGYQHQWTDPTTGNVNMGARWYQPGTGTFASRDTAALDPTDLTTANRHAYTASNPLTSIDPTGHSPACAGGLLAGPGAPFAVGACLIGAALIGAALLHYAHNPPSVSLPDISWSNTHAGTGTTVSPDYHRWGPGRRPDGDKPRRPGPRAPEWSNGNANSQNPPPPGRSNYGHWNADNEKDPNPRDNGSSAEQAAQALQVLRNALTEAERPELRETIAAGIQALIDAANFLPAIDLGVFGGRTDGDLPFQPEHASTGSGLGQVLPQQGREKFACQVGGYLGADVFGDVSRGGQTWLWECEKGPAWKRVDFRGQRVYQRNALINPYYASPEDDYGRTNLKRMQQGLAPMGPDDRPLNLHHMLQTQDGPIVEITHSMHFGYYNVLHWKAGTAIPSGIDRSAFDKWKREYWKHRAKGF
ncbi:HNH/ENDO VII family nuclease [Actinosynnema sp. NPDC004786]